VHDQAPVQEEASEGFPGGGRVVLDAGLDIGDVGEDFLFGRMGIAFPRGVAALESVTTWAPSP
jgi:hypothetical protein